jgi:serine/threonine-protein kinase
VTTLAAGLVLGGAWRLVRPLGHGGMGVVWAAEHVQVGRRAAIKTLRAEFAADERSLLRFRQEAVAAGSIGSPHIVEMLDFGTAPDGAPFLAMELLEGETLWGAMDCGVARLPLARLVDILGQTLAGVGAAHARGIVHRDLKPENIFLSRFGERQDFVKLLDFGLARVRGGEAGTRLTRTGIVLGTPSYMAPEQILGEREVDHRADLWAVGVILFRGLTGRRPFDGPSPAERIAAMVSQPPVELRALRPDLDEGLAAVVRRALGRRPAERFQSAEEFRAALAPYAGGCASPYATSGFVAPFADPPPGAASFPPAARPPTAAQAAPGAAIVPAPAARAVAPSLSFAAAPPRASGARRWPWLVAGLGVVLAGVGVGWLVGRGGGETADPATASARSTSAANRARLGDRELYLRVNVDLRCPGPDGRTPAAAGASYAAQLDEVLARHGLDREAWLALGAGLEADGALLQELYRRLAACGLPEYRWLVAPSAPPAATTLVLETGAPEVVVGLGMRSPPAALPAEVGARRAVFIELTSTLSCRVELEERAHGELSDEASLGLITTLLTERRLTPGQLDLLTDEFTDDDAASDEIHRRVAACLALPAASSGGPESASPVAPGGPLPSEPAAQRELYVTVTAEWECERARREERRTGEGYAASGRIQGEVGARHGLTTVQYYELSARFALDPAAAAEVERRRARCGETAPGPPQDAGPPEP